MPRNTLSAELSCRCLGCCASSSSGEASLRNATLRVDDFSAAVIPSVPASACYWADRLRAHVGPAMALELHARDLVTMHLVRAIGDAQHAGRGVGGCQPEIVG